MLSAEVVNLLNEQVKKEMFASNLYLNMSSWCYKNHFDGAGEFLFAHAEEERDHATKLIKYLNDTDSKAVIDTIAKPESEFDSLLDVFEKTRMAMIMPIITLWRLILSKSFGLLRA